MLAGVVWDPPADLVGAATELRRHVWGDFDGHDPALDPRLVVLVVAGEVVAALDVLSKDIDHDGQRLRASGLSSVATHPQHLRHGYGRHLVQAIRLGLVDTGVDLAIFTCDRELGRFYAAAGWDLVPDAVLVGGTLDDPFRSDQFDKVVLAARFTDAARNADLNGRDIAVYPGLRDRLW